MAPAMDRSFLRRAYGMTLGLMPLVSAYTALYLGWRAALSVALGAVLGVANFRLIEECAVHFLRPAGPARWKLAAAIGLKLPLLYTVGYLLLAAGWALPEPLAAGFGMIFAVIFLKALGRLWMERVRRLESRPLGDWKGGAR